MKKRVLEKEIGGENIDVLASNLRKLLYARELDIADLHAATGIAVTTLNSLKRGVGNPTLSTLKTLANFFNISVSQLTENPLEHLETDRDQFILEIPLTRIGDLNNLTESRTDKMLLTGIANNLEEKKDKIFAVEITNNSMAPFFDKGAIFVLLRDQMPNDGDIVLVNFKNTAACFRKLFIIENSYYFNPIASPLENKLKYQEEFKILGVVIKVIQSFY